MTFPTQPASSGRPPPQVPLRERGAALIITLGVLSLLLILAMSFAYTTRTERMAAGNYADMVKARLLCESGMERVAGGMRSLPGGYLYPGPAICRFQPTSGPWAGRFLLPSLSTATVSIHPTLENREVLNVLKTVFGTGTYLTSSTIDASDVSPSPTTGWSYVYSSSPRRLIGRIAYLILDDSGKLDPTYVVSSSVTENLGSEFFTGTDVRQIQLDAIPGFSTGTGTRFSPSSLSSSGRMLAKADGTPLRWFSMQHIYRTFGQTSTDSNNSLFPFSQDDCTATGTATLTPTAEWYEFDTPFSNSFNASGSVTTAAHPRYSFSNTASLTTSSVTSNIPWIAGMIDDTGTSVANQVAANLVDYTDTDSSASCNIADLSSSSRTWPIGSAEPDPAYVGLEKVPYINEVNLATRFTSSMISSATAATSTYQYSLTMNTQYELVNIYTDTVPPLTFSGTLRAGVYYTGSGINAADCPSPVGITSTCTLNNGSFDTIPVNVNLSSGNYVVFNQSHTLVWTTTALQIGNFTLKVGRIAATLVNATATATLADFSKMGPASATLLLDAPMTIGFTSTKELNYQVADPRCNTRTSDWTSGLEQTLTKSNSAIANPSSASGSGDTETVTKPEDGISTAFIRNGPIQSLWELGAIHRGEPWRTINLRDYNSVGYTPTGVYKYANGDANLLDQVVLPTVLSTGTFTAARGRFNLNSRSAEAWRTVLGSVQIRKKYEDTTAGAGDHILSNTVLKMTNSILISNSANIKNAIGKIAGYPELTTTSVLSSNVTDRAQEEIVGKLANLLTVRPNFFTVIVVGQSVKDLRHLGMLDDTDATPIAPATATDYSKVTNYKMSDTSGSNKFDLPNAATASNWALYYTEDTDTDHKKRTYFCAAQSEQKILAVLYRDAFTNQVKVLRYEYLDE